MKTSSNRTRVIKQIVLAGDLPILQHEEKERLGMELSIANKELLYQNDIKIQLKADLITTDNELILEKLEVGKRVAELKVANKQLLFQFAEKEKLVVRLAIANEKLNLQNIQNEKRAEELEIANQELLHQNEINKINASELKEALNELESFSYSVSHDLRAPLRAISGLTQVLAEDYVGQLDDEAKELIKQVIENSNKMGELIDNLLEFSRLGKQHISMGDVNVNQLVDTIIAEQKLSESNSLLTLNIKIMDRVKGDRNMLKQVFINLISNAVKYSGKKERPIIDIGSYREGNNVIYYVKDNGVGFDMNYYDKLFGVFQRLHSGYEFEGTGVGLAIVQKIITKHHGKVWAKSKVNEGASFFIALPNP